MYQIQTMNHIKVCLYCFLEIEDDNYLYCLDCKKNVHIKCLKRPGTPGDLLGDVFFEFKCSNCTDDGKEEFVRTQLPWAMLVVIAIYNLSISSKGFSYHGYFHWRTHICNFIEKNWNYLIGPNIKRKKKWTGTISGALSTNAPAMFTSGLELLKDTGWWKLTYNYNPKQYMDLYNSIRSEKKKKDETILNESTASDYSSAYEHDLNKLEEAESSCSRLLPFMGREPRTKKNKVENDIAVEENFDDFLNDIVLNNGYINELSKMIPNENNITSNEWTNNMLEIKNECEVEDYQIYEPKIVQINNYQEIDDDMDLIHEPQSHGTNITQIKTEVESDTEEDVQAITCEPSLFKSTPKRRPPWEIELDSYKNSDDNGRNIDKMSAYEEVELLTKLRAVMTIEHASNVPAWIRRFYRKLCVRDLKRQLNKPIFDIDAGLNGKLFKNAEEQILDRYHHLVCSSTVIKTDNSMQSATFSSRLIGSVQYDVFESPFTGRRLHPFIYKNTKIFPPWLKLMCELQYTVNGGVIPTRDPIDFCYVRPHHIAAVNGLLQKHFWKGIDMSDCLSYPDFSIIALYKKLVVGCAFLVPDVGHNDAYVSFMAVRQGWQRAGIASFMLYHLTQTCMGKDITLHVSATNPAICLYQKFGFKIEEVILDFYEKYLPSDSTHSRHAFFLRLKR